MTNRSAQYGTAVVIAHLFVSIVHGQAHRTLHIGLDAVDTAYVAVVITILPLVAMALLWSPRRRLGLGLLLASMTGALVFGIYAHFFSMGPDQVGHQSPGSWADTFAVTSYLLALCEVAGAYVGAYYLYAGSQ